jgi:hypothetical protein
MAFELLDHRSPLARQFAGTLETVITRDPNGAIIPILNFYPGEGQRIDDPTASRLAQNIVDVLNGRKPAEMTAQGIRPKWARHPQGFNIVFQQEADLSKKMGVLVLFNKSCPFEDIAAVSDLLAEANRLDPVLRSIRMVPAAKAPALAWDSPHQR